MADQPITRRITPGQDPATRLGGVKPKEKADAPVEGAAQAEARPVTTQDQAAVTAKGGPDATAQAITGAKPAAEGADLGAALDKLKAKEGTLQRFKENDPAAVKDMQQKLKDLGHYQGEVDGKYGPATDKAVRDFQTANKDEKGEPLKVDGAAGAKTRAALDQAAKAKAAATPAGGATRENSPEKPGNRPEDKNPAQPAGSGATRENSPEKPGNRPEDKAPAADASPADAALAPYRGQDGHVDTAKLTADLQSEQAADRTRAEAALPHTTTEQRAAAIDQMNRNGLFGLKNGFSGDETRAVDAIVKQSERDGSLGKVIDGLQRGGNLDGSTAAAIGTLASPDGLRGLPQGQVQTLYDNLGALAGTVLHAHHTAYNNLRAAGAK